MPNNKFKSALKFLRDNKIKMLQRPKELRRLFNLISEMDAKVFVEIGSGQGASAYVLAQAMPKGGSITMIDINENDKRWKVVGKLSLDGYMAHQVIGNAHELGTFWNISMCRVANEKWVDVLFIDGDHHYDAVKTDYDLYKGVVRDGGIIAFHDIVRHPKKPKTQVWKLWKELKAKHDVIEFIESGKRVGIGVIKK